jgi:arylsulfatase A-like enzyme
MSRPPNILWLVTTQWRAQATGVAGDLNVRTRCFDALAAVGRHYSQAVTPHPFGPWARAALLTGLPSPRNGIRDYFDPLPAQAHTVAHALNDRGYRTAFFGKWQLAPRDPRAPLVGDSHAKTIVPPEYRGGFDFWEGFESGFLLNDPWLHGTRRPQPEKVAGYQSDVIAGLAAEWIQSAAQPWFLVVSVEAPHPPYHAPAADCVPPAPGSLTLPPNVPRGGETEGRARQELSGYYAHIEATDRALGRLIEAPTARDAVVMWTSVHGDMHGAHGLFRKGWPHEESVRVPLVVRDPRAPAAIDARPVSLVALSAATLAWVDRPAAIASPGYSLISMPSVVALPDQCPCRWQGVRTATRKIVFNESGKPWLLHDLERDPGERRNLAGEGEHTAEFAAAQALLKATD